MIESKDDLKEYLKSDMKFYHQYSVKDRIILKLLRDPSYQIMKYVHFLRHEEYYFNVRRDLLGRFLYYYYLKKKNGLGNRLGFKIPKNCFEWGLTIYHHGSIIVNETARIGANCKLHGNNCIGNKGTDDITPLIGDDFDLGFGASVIGGVKLGNHIVVGANAVVVNSVEEDFVTLVGVPAKMIKG